MSRSRDVVVSVSGISKAFDSGSGKVNWALKDISFEAYRGDIIGVVGKNGSGKSTLLKILSGITKPTEGKVEIEGRVASVLDVGAGFHPDLSGRENVYLRGELLGMSRAGIESVFEDIVAFSNIGHFIDSPVKFYSDGMFLRLAFSVIVHLDFDVLLLDEVMQVGDLEFRKKTEAKIIELAGAKDKTLMIVSHNVGELASLANRFMVLEQGKFKEVGVGLEVLRSYVSGTDELDPDSLKEDSGLIMVDGYRVERISMVDPAGAAKSVFTYEEAVGIEFRVVKEAGDDRFPFVIQITDCFEHVVVGLSYLTVDPDFKCAKEQGEVRLMAVLPSHLFNFGRYYISLLKVDSGFNFTNLKRKMIHFDIVRSADSVAKWYDNSPAPIRPVVDWKIS